MKQLNYQKKIVFSGLNKESVYILKKIEKMDFPNGFLEFINYVFSELLANVKEHSKAKEVTIIIKISGKDCLIKIADKGIGLRGSYLLKKVYPKDDYAAIEFALSGLSTKNLQERGFGLYSIRKLTNSLKGKMIIESGFAKTVIEENKIIFKNISKKTKGLSVSIETQIKKIDFYKNVE